MAETVIKTVPRGRGELLRILATEILRLPAYQLKTYAGQLVVILVAAHYENEDSDIRREALTRATKLLDEAQGDIVVAEVVAVAFPKEPVKKRARQKVLSFLESQRDPVIAAYDEEDTRIRDIAAGITVVD